MLAFVNYAHCNKKYSNYASTFYFIFGENTSKTIQQKNKWQTYLPYSETRLN